MIKEHIRYLKDNPEQYWFKAKLYGWGWTPAKWQGWLVLCVYLLLVVGLTFNLDEKAEIETVLVWFMLPITLLTLGLIGICYKTGETPKWQWGPKK